MSPEIIIGESQVDYKINAPARLSQVTDTVEGVEAIVEKEGVTYPVTITPSFGPEIVNPDIADAIALAYGQKLPAPNPNAPVSLLVGLQANGRCGADCKGCVFANHRVGSAMGSSALARPVDPQTMTEIIALGKTLIAERELVAAGQTIRVNALLSGDPSYTPYVEDLICMVSQDPEISASRWSTIAANTPRHPLRTFVNATYNYVQMSRENEVVAAHKPRFQVSLHSTDIKAREKHVGHYRGEVFPQGLATMSTIAAAFYHIKENTGFSSTVSFVLHAGSVIDPKVLRSEIPPDISYVCVRPIIATDDDSTHPMPLDVFTRLYSDLREEGYTVVVMPPIGLEMDNVYARQYHRSLAA
jgi:hypothetical protein